MEVLRQEDGALQTMFCRSLRPGIVNAFVADVIALLSPRARRSAPVSGFVTLICVPNVRRFGEFLRQLMRKMTAHRGLAHGERYTNEERELLGSHVGDLARRYGFRGRIRPDYPRPSPGGNHFLSS
jgi:hypothetical protein